AAPSQSRVLVPPPARRPTGNVAAPPPESRASRRDPIAEREARKAGVGRSSGAVPAYPVPQRDTNSQGRASQRIMRDGKLLDTLPPKRRPTSPVQALPRRKEPAQSGSTTNPQRSPVLKGTRRGPDEGSE
ncbi:MAG: hypothetical protein AB1938_32655, partial [Myxococcota bacterium]